MDPPRPWEVAIMSEQLNRYHNKTIIEHLAHQYVLGLLTSQVCTRVEKLLITNHILEQRVIYWQDRFSSFDKQTTELAPKAQTWQNIQKIFEPQINDIAKENEKHHGLWSWFSFSFRQTASIFSLTAIVLLSYLLFAPQHKEDPLSYVAVLTDKNQQAQLVASTYGESKKLIINVINTPKMTTDQDLEIWVISKRDQQARSLGVIPRNTLLVKKRLSTAQWRLIKDSDSLIVTIEDLGGSPIGEPSELVVSRGLCVRLKEWAKNV